LTQLRLLAVCGLLAGCAGDPTDVPSESRPDLAKAGSGPSVSAVAPDNAPQDTTLDIQVLGSGYDQGSRVDLALGGTPDPVKVHTNSTRYVTSTQLIANITISLDATLARYDVMVTTSSGKKGIGTERFLVRAVYDIGTLGGSVAVAQDVSSTGMIVGNSTDPSGLTRGFVWTEAGGMSALPGTGTLSSGTIVKGVNDGGIIVGYVRDRAARWQPDGAGSWVMQDLGTLGGSTSYAYDVNGAGTVVGYSSLASGSSAAFRWTAGGGMVALPMGGGSGARALGISESGVIVGDYIVATRQVPVAWPAAGGLVPLPLCSGAVGGHALDINVSGVVVGDCGFSKTFQAVRWLPGAQANTWLPPEPLASPSQDRAEAINDAGEIVGRSADRPFLWDQAHGLRFLGTFVLNGGGYALGINNPAAGEQSRVVGTVGSSGASSGSGRAVWWRHP
jgi:probable HAF family extracellular repeat protein